MRHLRGRTTTGRRRQRSALGSFLAVVVMAGACGDGEPTLLPTPSPAPAVQQAWSRVAPGPLATRRQAAAVWTGREVLVFGGSADRCPRRTCRTAEARQARDAAAYNPGTDRWRVIAPLPVAMPGVRAAVSGRLVFALSSSFLAYDVDRNRWRKLPPPPFPRSVRLTATADGRVVATAIDHKSAQQRDYEYDVAASRWFPLPDDPIGVAYNRWTLPAPDGGLVLLAVQEPADPGLVPPVYGAARLDRDARQWTLLPNSAIPVGIQVWWPVGGLVVSALGGRLRGTNFAAGTAGYRYGGFLDAAAGRWRPLPEPVPPYPGGSRGALAWAHAAGARTVVADRYALDLPAGRWLRIDPPPPDAAYREEAAVTWAGDRLFVWGGESRRPGAPPRPRASGWTWRAAGWE